MTAFQRFYFGAYQDEHRHPGTVALHVAGTVGGLALAPAAFALGMPWLILLFPVVHAVPGLIGHRLFERNAAVGDVRVTRTDHPIPWFVAANHWLLVDVARSALTGRPRAELTARARERAEARA